MVSPAVARLTWYLVDYAPFNTRTLLAFHASLNDDAIFGVCTWDGLRLERGGCYWSDELCVAFPLPLRLWSLISFISFLLRYLFL
jgi:hypothetical protein